MKAESKSSEHNTGTGELWEQVFDFAWMLMFKMDLVLLLLVMWHFFDSKSA